MKNIATALVKAQKAFGPALKTSTNPHFRSRYADLSACVEAVVDSLNTNGIYLLQKNYVKSFSFIITKNMYSTYCLLNNSSFTYIYPSTFIEF